MAEPARCRHCAAPLRTTFLDLGVQAVANSFIPPERADDREPKFPLHTRVCERCWLVQVDQDLPADEIFSDSYAYFSSFSESWLEHARQYAERMRQQLGLNEQSLVVEIASNDGYLLKNFVADGIPVLGIEPAANVAAEAEKAGIPTIVEFFGQELAERLRAEGRFPDLICSANVLAHVPDINDFVAGIAQLLTGNAVYTVEYPHLLNLIEQIQFDTIYHEHYSYLSLLATETIFRQAGLRVFDVEELPTHGGSLRVFACRQDADIEERPGVHHVRDRELAAGLNRLDGYTGFAPRVRQLRDEVVRFLQQAKSEGRSVAAYGAAAKGNTLLNYCSVGPDLIQICVDRNPAKVGTLLPGSRIPVRAVEALYELKPDYVVILPWNLRTEITTQLADLRESGTRFVTTMPSLTVIG